MSSPLRSWAPAFSRLPNYPNEVPVVPVRLSDGARVHLCDPAEPCPACWNAPGAKEERDLNLRLAGEWHRLNRLGKAPKGSKPWTYGKEGKA